METKEGSIRATLPWNLPIDQRAFEPLGTLTNPARIGCRHLTEDEHSRGSITTPKPSSSGLENFLFTDTEPRTTDRPIDQRHAVEATSWRRLHRDQPPQVGWRLWKSSASCAAHGAHRRPSC